MNTLRIVRTAAVTLAIGIPTATFAVLIALAS